LSHKNLKAAATVTTVIPKLTQGPQSIAPAITAIANNGQKDLPSTSPVRDKNVRFGRVIGTLSSLKGVFCWAFEQQAVRTAVMRSWH
jgi:hypothetical protein